MSDINEKFEQLIDRFTKWAEKQDDIRGAFIIGSRARKDIPGDEWSDLDLPIITSDPDRYINDTRWLHNIGKHYLTFLEKTPNDEGIERRVLFEGGLDVDFPITPLSVFNNHTLNDDDLLMLYRGFRILVDKDDRLAAIGENLPDKPRPNHPSPAEFDNCVNDFFYHAVLAVKKFKRGELFYAKSVCDSYMKRLLLSMISWHARAKHGLDYDVWHDSRFFERWANFEFVDGLGKAYATYSAEDFPRALRETISLFRLAAIKTAEILVYNYPDEGDKYSVGLIEEYLTRKY
ncbi:MAG: aminoglycoside 6-adenylyltransferase [candidate division Zixibacteria bacterium]|nr:aminoglycoside 6-adenylyltransferase [candidate division Zixibacteria bacterium]